MTIITNKDLELVEKFRKVFDATPADDKALDLWSGLSVEEYSRLIVLFEQNKPIGMSDEVRLDLIEVLKRLKAKLIEFKAA
jgi:hypothetical protein